MRAYVDDSPTEARRSEAEPVTEPFPSLRATHALLDATDALLRIEAICVQDLDAAAGFFAVAPVQVACRRLEEITAELIGILASRLEPRREVTFVPPPTPPSLAPERQEAVEIVEAILAEPEQPLPAPDPDERLSVEAAALALGIAPYKVYYAIQHGHLPASGPPRALGVARQDLEVYRETKLGKRAPKPTLAGRLGEEIPRSR